MFTVDERVLHLQNWNNHSLIPDPFNLSAAGLRVWHRQTQFGVDRKRSPRYLHESRWAHIEPKADVGPICVVCVSRLIFFFSILTRGLLELLPLHAHRHTWTHAAKRIPTTHPLVGLPHVFDDEDSKDSGDISVEVCCCDSFAYWCSTKTMFACTKTMFVCPIFCPTRAIVCIVVPLCMSMSIVCFLPGRFSTITQFSAH